MSIRKILNTGFHLAFKNLKLLVLFWATNTIMAFVLSIPIYSLLIDNLGHSLYSDQLAVQFDYFWYVQFINIYSGTIAHLPMATYSIVILYIFIQNFYFGGMVAVFHMDKKNHISDFFYGGVRYWYRFAKVVAVAILFFVLAFQIYELFGNAGELFFTKQSDLKVDFLFKFSNYVLFIFLVGIVTIITDYSRVYLAIEDKVKIFKGIYSSIKFIRKNFKIAFLVFLIVAVIGAFGAVVYNIVETYVPREPFYFLILSFILQQMLIIFRLFVRMIFTATEVIIYKDFSADVVSPEVYESKIKVS